MLHLASDDFPLSSEVKTQFWWVTSNSSIWSIIWNNLLMLSVWFSLPGWCLIVFLHWSLVWTIWGEEWCYRTWCSQTWHHHVPWLHDSWHDNMTHMTPWHHPLPSLQPQDKSEILSLPSKNKSGESRKLSTTENSIWCK